MTYRDTYVTYEKPANQRGRDSLSLFNFYEGVGANMSDVVIVALITGGLTLVGTIITNAYTHKRVKAEQAQQTKLVLYRIEQLEKKVEKHNNLVERMFKVEERCQVIEEKIKVANHRISDLERDLS